MRLSLSKSSAGLTQRTAALPLCPSFKLPSPNRLNFATRAGLTTLLIGWLALALFFAPYWAAQTNFPGHHHPNGVPPHTHSIQVVLGYALVVAAVVAVRSVLQPSRLLSQLPAVWLERTTPKKAHGSRAPPLLF